MKMKKIILLLLMFVSTFAVSQTIVHSHNTNVKGKVTATGLELTGLTNSSTSSTALVQIENLGADATVNGNFNTDTGWTKIFETIITGGEVHILSSDGTFSSAHQSNANYTATEGKTVLVTINISEITSGSITVSFQGGAGVAVPNVLGSQSFEMLNDGTVGRFNISRAGGVTDIKVTSVSVKEVLPTTGEIQKRTLGSAAFQDIDETAFVPYIGADKLVDLGSQTLTTTGTVSGDTFKVTSTNSNLGFGLNALSGLTSGLFNTVVGASSGNGITSGSQNTVSGSNSFTGVVTATGAIAIGAFTATDHTSGDFTTAVGSSISTGNADNSLFLGALAVSGGTNQTNEIVIGPNTTGNLNNSFTYGNASITKHVFTSGSIDGSFFNVTSTDTNTKYGKGALELITSGTDNTASGFNSGDAITSGGFHVLYGSNAGTAITTSFGNSYIGFNAGSANTSGSDNTGVGKNVFRANTTGSRNTSIGSDAGRFITGGAIGNTDSSDSVFIGRNTRALGATGINEIVLGANVTGNGTDSATYGSSSISKHIFTGGYVQSPEYRVSALNAAPASATATGTTGEIRYTATHIYLCTATNTWVRAALSTF